MHTRLRHWTALALCLLLSAPAYGQEPAGAGVWSSPANLTYVEGRVDIVHEGLAERADAPLLLFDGDIIRTDNGFAEVVFGDGTLLHLDRDAELELLGSERMRLLRGRALVRVSAAARQAYDIDVPAATVRLEQRGEYTVSAGQGAADLVVTVIRGMADVDAEAQRVQVRAGDVMTLRTAAARPVLARFNSARLDAFTHWSYTRSHGFATSRSAAQLPPELRPYAPILDQYGRWDTIAPHGDVWLPAVTAGWRPYYDGSWTHTRYGWTWYGRDPFAWPTHHYGRWGHAGDTWFWIPARGWAPAWVSWGFAPGYVSWSPLGWHGGPVLGHWPRADHPAYAPRYDPWRGWTIIPRDRFGGRRPVRTHAIDGRHLDEATRRAVIVQNTPPLSPVGGAVPRGSVVMPGGMGSVTIPDATGRVRRSAPDESARPGDARRSGAPDASARPGDVRRGAPDESARPGDVRRPAGAIVTPGARRVLPVQPAPATSSGAGRTGDAPEYAPPASWRGEPRNRRAPAPESAGGPETGAAPAAVARPAPRERPSSGERSAGTAGAADPQAAPAERGSDGRGASRARPAPSAPRAEPQATRPAGERDGAVERGGPPRRGGGAAGAPVPRGSSAGAEGGARRKPPS
jgi:hypothetical protein